MSRTLLNTCRPSHLFEAFDQLVERFPERLAVEVWDREIWWSRLVMKYLVLDNVCMYIYIHL